MAGIVERMRTLRWWLLVALALLAVVMLAPNGLLVSWTTASGWVLAAALAVLAAEVGESRNYCARVPGAEKARSAYPGGLGPGCAACGLARRAHRAGRRPGRQSRRRPVAAGGVPQRRCGTEAGGVPMCLAIVQPQRAWR